MNFVKNLDIGETLTDITAQHDKMKIQPGYLLHYEIRLTSGTDVTTTLRILHGGIQIMPSNRDEALKVTNIFHRMPAFTPLLNPPHELEFVTTNSAGTHNYVSVALEIVDRKMLSVLTGLTPG